MESSCAPSNRGASTGRDLTASVVPVKRSTWTKSFFVTVAVPDSSEFDALVRRTFPEKYAARMRTESANDATMMRAILPCIGELAELVSGRFTLERSFLARWKAGHFTIRL